MPSLAFIHEWLTIPGGSERVLDAASALYPEAPIYTLVYDKGSHAGWQLENHPIRTSFLQRLPGARRGYKRYLPLMPLAVEQFDLRAYDLLISSSHAVAKGVLTRPDQLHISYTHTPMRYAWDMYHEYLSGSGLGRGVRGAVARLVLHYLRIWDSSAADRVDVYISNSAYVARRIWKTYRRRAQVLHPPVDVERFQPADRREDFYLTVSRLVPYKRVDLIVEAFNRLGLPLVVIGGGPGLEAIRRQAGPGVEVLGQQDDPTVAGYMGRCKAFVYAAQEDFGITPVEAMASGAPVIAFGEGGVTESVVEGETGLFFHDQSSQGIVDAVRSFEGSSPRFSPERLSARARRFSKSAFQDRFQRLVGRAWQYFSQDPTQRFDDVHL
jgi:glycosyltransferase involved in cell wall biosynthesis